MSDKDETKVTETTEGGVTPETPVTEAPAETIKVESKSEAKRKAVVKEAKAKKDADAPASTDGEDAPATEAKQFVILRSADKRQLEASIGDQVWKGTEISVPVEQAGDVRRLLEDGGFFLKD